MSLETAPTRRERLRTATVAEIKQLARRLLVDGGPSAISLRAIARDMGMTAPAIYRYFASLDALVQELVEDFFDELRGAVEAVPVDPAHPAQQLMEMARALRRWSVAHPAEFALMFGSPLPGVEPFDESCLTPDHAGARLGAPFLVALGEMWRTGGIPTPPPAVLEARLQPHLAPYRTMFGPDVPIEVIYTYLSAWTRLYGMVAMEVFGHLRWALTAVEPLFELELAAFAAQLTAGAGLE
jgi:AcrR family transcriptional regulator